MVAAWRCRGHLKGAKRDDNYSNPRRKRPENNLPSFLFLFLFLICTAIKNAIYKSLFFRDPLDLRPVTQGLITLIPVFFSNLRRPFFWDPHPLCRPRLLIRLRVSSVCSRLSISVLRRVFRLFRPKYAQSPWLKM